MRGEKKKEEKKKKKKRTKQASKGREGWGRGKECETYKVIIIIIVVRRCLQTTTFLCSTPHQPDLFADHRNKTRPFSTDCVCV